MANLDYNLESINKGIEGGIAYLKDFKRILDTYGEGDDKGTLKALMETIDAAINGYITANPSVQDITDNNLDNCVKSGISYIKVTKDTINAPEKPTNDTELYAYLLVLKFGTVTSQFFILTNNGKYYYRRQNNTTWSEWFNFIQDGPLSTTWEKMKRGLQSQTGFNMAGHNEAGNYDYNLALVNNQDNYGLQDDTTMILYKNKGSGKFIYDGELNNIVPISKGGSGLSESPNMIIDLASENSVNIMDKNPVPGIKGKLSLKHGGTNNDLSNIPPFAIIRRVSKEEAEDKGKDPYLYYITTDKGALYGSEVVTEDSNDKLYKPVFGTLPIACGGTGRITSPSLLVDLNSTTAADLFSGSPRPGVTGILPVERGGTGSGQIYKSVNIINGTKFTSEINQHGPKGTSSYTTPVGKLYSKILTWDPDGKFYNLGTKVGTGTSGDYITEVYLNFTQQAGGLVLLRLTIDNLKPKETIAANTILNLLKWDDEFDFDPLYSMALSFYSTQNLDAQARIVSHTWKVDEHDSPLTTATAGKIGLRLLTEMKTGSLYDIYISGVYRGQYSNY